MSLEILPNFFLDFSERGMTGESTHSYRFKSFRLDLEERQLLHNESPVSLTPKAFDVLAALVERAGHLVEKDELLKTVWADSFVEESNVARIVHTLRRVLGEDQNGNKFIETVAKSGYRFVAEVELVQQPKLKSSETADDVLSESIVLDGPTEIDQLVPLTETSAAEPKGQTRIVLFGVGFLTAVSMIFLLSFDFRSASSEVNGTATSFAVLPLKPINTAARDELYEIGIAESLIHKIGSMKGFVVRHLSATRRYTDVNQDPLVAGREQKVDYVLASTYQLANGKIQVSAQLFNVANGQIEETYKSREKDAAGLFAMQDEIANEVGNILKTRFGITSISPVAKRGTDNEAAYRLYLQGAALADKYSQEEVRKAIDYFEQAVRLDPNYAPAYARLASAQTAVVGNRSGAADEQYPKTKAAIEKALGIDDNLSEAHSYLGEIKSDFEGDFAGSEREHKRAIELNPNSSIAHRMYALLLTYLGRHDEAITESKTAIDLEPVSVMNHLVFGRSLLFARRYDEAIAQLERTAEMDPEFFFPHLSLSVAYRLQGDNDRAFESFVKTRILVHEKPDEIDSWKATYAQSGWPGVLELQLDQAQEKEKIGKPNYNLLANLSSDLGHREEAFSYLEKALAQHGTLTMLKVHPRFDPLRDDPRFDELLERTGLK